MSESSRLSTKPTKDWSNFKPVGCKVHGFKHLWKPDASNLCLHPSCLQGLVRNTAERNTGVGTRWNLIKAWSLEEDFIQHLSWWLLAEKEKDKLKHLNAEAMIWCLSKFLDWSYGGPDNPHTSYVKCFVVHERLNEQAETGQEDILSKAVSGIVTQDRHGSSAFLQELMDYLGDKTLYLLVCGQIDPEDYARLTVPTRQVLAETLRIKQVMPWLGEWMKSHAET